jgi:hypothetical protein
MERKDQKHSSQKKLMKQWKEGAWLQLSIITSLVQHSCRIFIRYIYLYHLVFSFKQSINIYQHTLRIIFYLTDLTLQEHITKLISRNDKWCNISQSNVD